MRYDHASILRRAGWAKISMARESCKEDWLQKLNLDPGRKRVSAYRHRSIGPDLPGLSRNLGGKVLRGKAVDATRFFAVLVGLLPSSRTKVQARPSASPLVDVVWVQGWNRRFNHIALPTHRVTKGHQGSPSSYHPAQRCVAPVILDYSRTTFRDG